MSEVLARLGRLVPGFPTPLTPLWSIAHVYAAGLCNQHLEFYAYNGGFLIAEIGNRPVWNNPGRMLVALTYGPVSGFTTPPYFGIRLFYSMLVDESSAACAAS